MNWFIVVYFLVNGSWVEADKLNKEGWSPITQPNYEICMQKISESNLRFKKIADYICKSRGGEGAFREFVDLILLKI